MTVDQIKNKESFWDRIFSGELEHNRFGIISVVLIIAGCMGGFVMGSGGVLNDFQLIITVCLTMTNLTLVLAVQPLKYILNIAVVTIILDSVFICYNLF